MPPRYETVEVTVDDETISNGNIAAIVHPLWWIGNIYEGPEEYERSLRQFSNQQRLIFALKWYLAEVDNGGHRQFYSNSSGIVWKDACKAFAAIGLKRGADIILESADRLGGDPPLERPRRQEALVKYSPDFGELDARIYELEQANDIEMVVLEYIR